MPSPTTSEALPVFSEKPSTASSMQSPKRAETFNSEKSALSTSSKLTWKSTSSQTNKHQAYKPKKPKKPKYQTVQFSDVGRHSNQWLFNDMSFSDAVKTILGRK
ncbi:hypothetical protein BST61_g7925 [Cercospora zeina]